jgi:hypothetical protein
MNLTQRTRRKIAARGFDILQNCKGEIAMKTQEDTNNFGNLKLRLDKERFEAVLNNKLDTLVPTGKRQGAYHQIFDTNSHLYFAATYTGSEDSVVLVPEIEDSL